MSELINTNAGRKDFRRQLLTTASALALIGNFYSAGDAKADDNTDRPTLWIELGGQLEQQTGQGDAFSPLFIANNPDSAVLKPSPLQAQKPPLFSNGAEGKITFEPEGSDWVFSAAVRYGRSVGHKKFSQNNLVANDLQQSYVATDGINHIGNYGTKFYNFLIKKRLEHQYQYLYANSQVKEGQSHGVVDFAVGKDVGLGMFGKDSQSTFNVGVRFAQFTSKASGAFNVRPNFRDVPRCVQLTSSTLRYIQTGATKFCRSFYRRQTYAGSFQSRRSFHGIGPTLSWNASVPILGEQPSGSLNVDWGANAAVLFGRQQASGTHQSYARSFGAIPSSPLPTPHTSVGGFNRSRTIVVPNIGGFAGLSFDFNNAKVALGYRGDFFFGAMDTGNDARTTKTVGLYGPFASISIGIGG